MMDALFLQVIGGVFLLLYGVRLTGQGFELAFGAKLSRLWVGPGGGRFRAFGAGVLGPSLIQSSGTAGLVPLGRAPERPVPERDGGHDSSDRLLPAGSASVARRPAPGPRGECGGDLPGLYRLL